MAIMVEAQDVLIAEIEQTAATVNHDMEKGVEQVQVAVKHARNARKWRWVCCAITTIILVRSSRPRKSQAVLADGLLPWTGHRRCCTLRRSDTSSSTSTTEQLLTTVTCVQSL